MKGYLAVAVYLFLFKLLVSCDTQFVELPSVLTTEVSQLGSDHAVAHGIIVDLGSGISDHGHCYSLSRLPEIDNEKVSLGQVTQLYDYSTSLGSLVPNSTYHVRAYLISDGKVYYGQDIEFTTLEGKIEISTDNISNVMAQSAICKGTLIEDGGHTQVTGGALWDENMNLSLQSYQGISSEALSEGQFEVQLSNLEPNKEYFVRTYAISEADTSYGNVLSFNTLDGIVSFGSSYVTELATTKLLCYSNIVNDGGSPVSARGICWSKSEEPTLYGHYVLNGEGIGAFISEADGLEAGTRYFIRTFATNGIKTHYSDQISITTKQ